ncbi:PspC domain-containing protein [Chitinophaga sp. GCM10012297]|uniref:PspC domain-containing protein n=1 Tax=Chitinophaga chungangae TaxID=2821488 RepID=A0ABS3YF10_9BACT|nr:PspC domain-containing protein [Chitinophaga chungangae]MBO9152888.1 PspC domain-containing protein [Chitinophaga chungangae]
MKKIININLSSRLIPIEDSAYEILRQYLDSLKRYFSQEEGADEIVGDIESRIAEIFQDKIRKGAHCITDEDVQAIKTSMGTPEQFGEEAGGSTNANQSNTSSSATESFAPYIRPRKRFYRDTDNKVLGGVCSGLGAYFNVDPIVFRIIFALMAIGLYGGGIVLYFILWFATPEAVTAAEKLEMRGERVDLNNIKNTVQEEMNSFRSRMEKMGDDVRNFSEGRGKQFGRDAGSAIEGFFRGILNIIGFMAKGFFLFLGVVMLFVLVVTLIMAAIFSAVLIPVKDLIFDAGPQTFLFWPALALLIGIPILALILFLVRKMTGIKQTNKYAGYTLGFFWILGIVFAVWLAVSVTRDFTGATRYVKEPVAITQPSKGRLVIRKAEDMLVIDDLNIFDGNLRVVDDTAIIGDIRLYLRPSPTDSFALEVRKSSHGRTSSQAAMLANEISYRIHQQDSVLYIPGGFSIPRNSVYRNQEVDIYLYVPKGRDFTIDRGVRHMVNDWGHKWWRNNRDYDWNDDDETRIYMNENGWEPEVKEDPVRRGTDSVYQNYRYQGPRRENDTPGKTPPAENTTPVEDSKQKDSGSVKDRRTTGVALLSMVFANAFTR